MTVKEAIKKYNKKPHEVRIYVQELEDEEWREIEKYFDSEVVRIYPHNGDMVCEVVHAR